MAQPAQEGPARDPFERIRADAMVTRRDYLRILVTISGGLAFGAVAVAVGIFPRRTGSAGAVKIADGLEPGSSVAFTYPSPEDRAIAMRLPNGMLVAYSSICTHLSCAVLWAAPYEELTCPCHEGSFDAATGGVLAGPPPRPLPVIELEERPDGIYAVGATVR
jgi:Rieske Fe-S protein